MRFFPADLRVFVIILITVVCLGVTGACSSADEKDTGNETENASGPGEEQPTERSASGADGTGCVAGNCENGTGTYVWPGGSKYVGQFKNSLRNGTGTYTWPSGSQYIGEYKDGLRNGKGAYNWSDGHSYVGEFQNDMKNGQGVYTWPDGTVFEGVWANDQRGEGQFSKMPGK